jgi:hypothetical protein
VKRPDESGNERRFPGLAHAAGERYQHPARGNGEGFQGQASSDFFDHRLDVTIAETNNAPTAACPLVTTTSHRHSILL